MILYRFSNDENENIVNIDDLDESDRKNKKYYCISCGNELVAKLGKIKQHHFAHKVVKECSGETYLHILGKRVFYDVYNDCINKGLPFYIEIWQKKICNYYEGILHKQCKSEVLNKIDLTKYFNNIVYEKREGMFIPDLMLTNKDNTEKLFIEIAVSHFVTNEKENSNYRIIEINIKNEDDLKIVYDRCLSINYENVKFINFKEKIKTEPFCSDICKEKFYFLSLDSSGRVLLKQYNLSQIKNRLDQLENKIIKYSLYEYEEYINADHYYTFYYTVEKYFFTKFIAMCAKENFSVKNCFICRYHAVMDTVFDMRYEIGKPIFCKFLKKPCNSNKAVECEYFRKEKKYIDEILNPPSDVSSLAGDLSDKLDNQTIVTKYKPEEKVLKENTLKQFTREQSERDTWEPHREIEVNEAEQRENHITDLVNQALK